MPFPRGAVTWLSAGFALIGLCGSAVSGHRQDTVNVLIGGDTQGYLAPCGCTYPMTGGIRRLATAVAQSRGSGGLFLENGGLIEERPPNGLVGFKQNALKALALADAFRAMGADAVNIGQEEVAAGRSTLSEIETLTDHAALSTSLELSPSNRVVPWIARGQLLIGGITPAAKSLAALTGETAVPSQEAVHRLIVEATRQGRTPILLFRGSESEAAALASQEPGLALIVYKSAGSAPTVPIWVGGTMLVTPGDRAKNVVQLEFDGKRFSRYQTKTLTPEYADEPKVSRYYADYLRQVERAKLIEQLARHKTAAFAGSGACMSCHAAAYKKWRGSAHAHALADLEHQGHARDPDCLACHVTGLASTLGFRTRQETSRLANVTCEACHGPARDHSLAPRTYRLPKLERKSCISCHSPDNSPNFSFEAFWPKISH